MKYFFVLILLICVVFPCFSQTTASERFQALSDAMGRTLENSNYKLQNYNEDAIGSENMKTYQLYRRKHESLSNALKDSEKSVELRIRTNDKAAVIKKERDHYEKLIKDLQTTKDEYDSWLKNVK